MNGYDIIKIDSGSCDFPARLREIPDPPKQLYCMGDLSLLYEKTVGVVGARKNTLYGKNVALMIGKRLAESGIPVTSGLALGIDGFSHKGALEAGGKTIGVIGSGLDNMTPASNYGLMKRGLENGGLVVSEYAPGEGAYKWNFPARNRIISGLSEAVIIVEAGLNSGSLITAKHAADQGRTVYAVPGNINSRSSIGSNLLIREGAIPLIVIDDVIRDVGRDPGHAAAAPESMDKDEAKVFESVTSRGGATIDEIALDADISAALASSIVTVMEIKGTVESYAGRIYPAK